MMAYHFLRTVETPTDPSMKPPSKNPNSILTEREDFASNKNMTDTSNSFIIHPAKSKEKSTQLIRHV
jgi:hypothetical protein